ncbi:MAG: hypothetical protein U1F66_02060 [bacterium]
MKNLDKTISVEDFLKLQELAEVETVESQDSEDEAAEVVDLGAFRKKTQAKKARRAKAKVQAVEMIQVVAALVRDYEDQMMAVAHEIDAQEWAEQHQTSPFEQIREDMRRLYAFVNALNVAVEFEGAATLAEACELIGKGGNGELIATLDYIRNSEYLGFQAIARVLDAVYLHEEHYALNVQSLGETWQQLEKAGFQNAVEPLAAMCFHEAVAI